MVKRLFFGLAIGLFVGGLLAAAIIKGMGVLTFGDTAGGAALAYVFAAVVGVLVGLVAGKPIWQKGGQIEAGLKAFFGALLGAGAMFALRRWAHVDINLAGIGAGPAIATEVGQLPAIALPVIAGVLGSFYEIDNTGGDDEEAGAKSGKSDTKTKTGNGKVRVATPATEADEEEEAAPPRKAKH